MASTMKDKVQPVVKDEVATPEEQDTDGTICIIGRRYKTVTAVAVASVLVTLVIAGSTMIWAGGVNANRVTVLEEKASTSHTVQEAIRETLGSLKTAQAVAQTTIEAVQTQMRDDRKHLDDRLNQLFGAIRRRPNQ